MALTFTKVISSSPRALVVLGSDGQTYSVTGDRSQRNNNPGAIAYSPVAVAHGAIGYDTININGKPSTRIAVFPDMASGAAAQQELLFGSDTNHPAYRNMTLQQAISKYAPADADGNPPPQSYYTRIANAIGISPDTLLSDLTPAQQAAFMQVQAGIEGSRPQKIADAQGNIVKFPPADVPTAPANGGDWASAFADAAHPKTTSALSAINAATTTPPLPPARPSMGPSPAAAFSVDNLYNQHWVPVPLAPLPSRPNSSLAANAGDSLGFNPVSAAGVPTQSLGSSDGGTYPRMDAQIDPSSGLMLPTNSPAIRSNFLPPPPNSSGSPDDRSSPAFSWLANGGATGGVSGGGTGSGSISLAPVPMPASARPVAPATVSAPPAPAAPPQTVQINGHSYVVGKPIQDPSGVFTYVPQANGTMLKMPHISIGANTVMGGIVGQKIKEAIPQVNAAVSDAAGNVKAAVGGAAGNAASVVGGMFNNLFNHPAPSPTPASYAYAPGQVGQSPAMPTAPSTVYHAPPVSQTPSSAYQAPTYHAPPVSQTPSSAYSSSSSGNYGTPGYSGNSSYGPSSYAPPIASMSPADLSSYSAPAAPKTVSTQVINPAWQTWASGQSKPATSPFTNPGVQGLSPDDRQALNDANSTAMQFAAQQTAMGLMPPKYITVKKPVAPIYHGAPPLAFPTAGNPLAAILNHGLLGRGLSLLGHGQNASDMLFGNGQTGIAAPPPTHPGLAASGMTQPQYLASQGYSPQAINGITNYGGAIMEGYYDHGGSGSGGGGSSLASRG